MKDKYKPLLYISFLLVLLVIAFIFDRRISLTVSSWRSAPLDSVMIYLKDLLVGYAVVIALSIYLFAIGKGRWVPVILVCMISADLTSHILKHLFPRMRPWDVLPITKLGEQASLSFPSGHVAFLIALVPPLRVPELQKVKWLRYLKNFWIIYVLIIGFNRIYVGAHFASDVIAGFLLGYLVGYSWVWSEKKYNIFEKEPLKRGWPIIVIVMLAAMATLNWWDKVLDWWSKLF